MTNRNYSPHTLQKVWGVIQQAKIVTLLTHRNPDADGISACAAMAYILEKLGKQVETIYPSKPEFAPTRQPKTVFINKHQQIPELIIAFDTANIERLYYPEAFQNVPLISIDHHISNSINAAYNLLNATASSTCEELYEIIKVWDASLIDQYVAECLLFGALYDTQVFHTQATTPATLRFAAESIENGANMFQLKNELLAHKDPKIITLWGRVLSTVTISPNGNAAWACIKQKDLQDLNLTPSSVVGFSNFLAQISGVDITIVFFETVDGKTKVSLRSKSSDVNALAGLFGGGGHKNASGITSSKPFDEIVQELTAKL